MNLKHAILAILLLGALLASANAQESSSETIRIWAADGLPVELLQAINPLFESDVYRWTSDTEDADLILDFEHQTGAVTTEWVYVPVVPFASVAEFIRWQDIRRYWAGDLAALDYLTPDDTPPEIVISTETYRALVSLLGDPAEGLPLRAVPNSDQIADELWAVRPNAWGIIGFNDLNPRLKVLQMDHADVFSDDFDAASYPLTARIDLKGDPQILGQTMEDLLALNTWQASNRIPSQMGRVVLTGVTAMSRATAFKMEENGITSPANGIMDFIDDAHLLHTSNEVAFSENCGPPDPFSGSVIFCSRPEYLELLTHIGLDVVELTGNHVNDYGPGALRYSLDIYAENNIATYGGGYDTLDARDAYLTEVNGTRIAFIGCNVPGPRGAFAADEREGAAACDEEFLTQELPRLSQEVDVLIVSVQEFEYYRYTVGIEQLRRFENYASLGADVVIGSQAHQPQGFTLSETGAFLHHGLGNLFFDQMAEIGTRQMFLDKLILYDGELINVVLFTGLIEDFCCPRPMTSTERADFLNTIFLASGW